MYKDFKAHLVNEIENTKKAGLYKSERIITSPQSSVINTNNQKNIINICSNNYLGLSSDPSVLEAAKESIDTHGYGMSSVRFICGTQNIHKDLEDTISEFLGTEDTILYAAAFDANGGLFEPLFGPEDAIISDELNHASIIDGIRLCKASRHRYSHNNMKDLEEKLQETQDSRARIIVTDGVFSMDGTIAQLDKICALAEKYNALIMIDECHSTGFMGENGKGVHELKDVMGKIDIITGTLGKALGGASGGFTSGRKEMIDLLRQKSRPYLFFNTLAPSIVGASLKVFEVIKNDKVFWLSPLFNFCVHDIIFGYYAFLFEKEHYSILERIYNKILKIFNPNHNVIKNYELKRNAIKTILENSYFTHFAGATDKMRFLN